MASVRSLAHQRVRPLMGTMASLRVNSDAPAGAVDAILGAALADLDHVEAVFSTYRDDSQISRVGRGELAVSACDPAVAVILGACEWMRDQSGGAFTVQGPGGQLDPSGFVKGWAIQRLSDRLVDHGLDHHLVGIGGDLMARGQRHDGSAWNVAIADPTTPGKALTTIDLTDQGVATSGCSERGTHIWSGEDDTSPYASLTVIGPTIMWADAFATAAFAMGAHGPAWVAGYPGYRTMTVDHGGAVMLTQAAV